MVNIPLKKEDNALRYKHVELSKVLANSVEFVTKFS